MSTGIEDLTARAKQLIAERAYQEAVRACRRVLLTRPDETPVRVLLGRALVALRRYDEARVEMLAVLRSHPGDAAAHRLLGEAYLRTGDPHRAAVSLQRALELDPDDEEARELMGEVAEETAPVSATIDRWFDPEAVATVQTDVPAFDEDHTGPVPDIRALRPPAQVPASVEVDPSLTGEARPQEPDTAAIRPARAGPPRPRSAHSSIPPPPSAGPPRAGPPKRGTLRSPPSSMPPPPRLGDLGHELEESTAAHRPVAMRPFPPLRPHTQELSIQDVDEIGSLDSDPGLEELSSYDELEGEATVARPGQAHPGGYGARIEDELESEQTLVREAHDDEGAAHAHDPWRAAPRLEPPPLGADPWAAPPPPTFPDDPVAIPGYPAEPFQPPPAFREGAPTADAARPGTPTPLTKLDPEPPMAAPPVRRGPLPTLRIRRSRLPLVAALVVAPVVLAVLGFVAVRAWLDGNAAEAVRAAADQASEDGLRSSLDEAIALSAAHADDDPEGLALRARLLATATLEHGVDHAEEAAALLAQLPEEAARLPDARAATAFLALARGDVSAAQEAVLTSTGESAELWRARALASAAGNDIARAVPAARAAVAERPTSPRHVALLAHYRALNRDTAAALELLDRLPEHERSPAVRLARARILLESGSDPRRAAQEAEAVIGELGSLSSPREKAWAHLVRARQAAFFSGDEPAALEEARAAAGLRPGGDEDFDLSLAETFLRITAPEEARDVVAALPPQSQEPQRRAKLVAEIALANGDVDAAAAALEGADEDARTAYLRGRIHEVRGRAREATALYERAMQDPRESVRARARLGALALAAGDARRAVELLDPAREREPSNLDVVPVLARALVATGEAERAAEVVRVALSLREGSPELLEAKAHVDLAQGQVQAALEALRQVAERRPTAPEVHAALGDAARQAGEMDQARSAFEKALELDSDHAGALIGLVQLAADRGDEDGVRAALQRAEAAGVSGAALDRARAEFLVLEGKGEEAIEILQRLVDGSEDAALWVALGRAQLQAERDRAAERSFDRALRLSDEEPEAHLGLALLQTRAGQLSRVARSIGAAERASRQRNLGPRFDARVLTARGRLSFELGQFDDATAKAREALDKDPESSEAHLLLANISIERNQDPIPHLRSAVTGRAPLPEAVGRLAIRLPRGTEACELARRYMRAAPEGYDAPDVQGVLARCR